MPVERGFVLARVDGKLPNLHPVIGRLNLPRITRPPAEESPNPRDQLPERNRLRHIIIGA
jgi:hypothetical protein